MNKRHIVEIPMRLPSLNEYIDACRTTGRVGYYKNRHWNKGNEMKQRVQKEIEPYLLGLGKFTKPVVIKFTWIEPDRRRDLDGICFAKKFILDAMVNAGIIVDDRQEYVKNFRDYFGYEKNKPKVIVEVIDDEKMWELW